MTEDLDALRELFQQDQRDAIESARDRAIQKCAEYTAQHYQMLVSVGMPEVLAEKLTALFQLTYLQTVLTYKPLGGNGK